ncbi:type II secretion system GspH family protein [Candidatus Dependentiae bacterium]|nr:type II secretion system GspH family protein [Candidatus Dependentiae bacterium]MBU4387439.1 type II secretion system GspH family protein [Candidatus Dependentiae bacterium]MCG2756017.1 type II secretion system GspH family protein [Candidatus Dependentiae bacterium]
MNQKAFTLIEIMVVMVVIGFMATIISTRFFKRKDNIKIGAVIGQFNNMLTIARQEAVFNEKMYRLLFKSEKELPDSVTIQVMEIDSENKNKLIPEKVYSEYLNTQYILPENFKIESVYLNKDDLLADKKREAFCYISKDGLVQNILIHIVKINEDQKVKYSFKVEPFIGEFQLVEGFLKPEK